MSRFFIPWLLSFTFGLNTAIWLLGDSDTNGLIALGVLGAGAAVAFDRLLAGPRS